MTLQTYNDICTDELLEGVIDNREWPGFYEDYRVLHCLIRKYKPTSFFEIGTNYGTGTKIIKNVIGDGKVYSLDLPTELVHHSLQPSADKKTDKVGANCHLPFEQLRGDSMTFDFGLFPCEGYFVDGEHTEENVYRETEEILKLSPKLIVYHDSDIPEVYRGWSRAVATEIRGIYYNIHRVIDTRIAYLVKKGI